MAWRSRANNSAEILYEEDVVKAAQVKDAFPDDGVRQRLLELGVIRPNPDDTFRITFVGLAVAGGRCFQVIPKIFKGSEIPASKSMRQVVRALRHYSRWQPLHHESAPMLGIAKSNAKLSAIAIADWLIRDYLAQGIYRRPREQIQRNGVGQISWSRTVEGQIPFISDGRPIYLDFVTRSIIRDEAYFVSRLHRQLLEKAILGFGHLLGYEAISLDHEPFETLTETPALAFCQAVLTREMRQAFTDRAIRLLPMLLAWLSAAEEGAGTDLSLYGMTSFHRVWEAACSVSLGNERDKWQGEIPRPKWTSQDGFSQLSDTFVPDIVTTVEIQPGTRYLLVADAKYYRLTMPPDLRGQPGVNDVAKQIWYEQCLADPALKRGYKGTKSIFIVPGNDEDKLFWPDGKVDLFSGGHSHIGITRLAPLRALERYTNGIPLNTETVHQVVQVAAELISQPD